MAKTVGPVWLVQPGENAPLPPDGPQPPDVNPDAPHVENPIVLPGDPSWGTDDADHPAHPIVIPPDAITPPDGETEPVGEPTFYQRKTLGINWDSSFDSAAVVEIHASDSEGDPQRVRTVANDGSSCVTYPQDFTGDVTIRVVGKDGYLEGTTTVQ